MKTPALDSKSERKRKINVESRLVAFGASSNYNYICIYIIIRYTAIEETGAIRRQLQFGCEFNFHNGKYYQSEYRERTRKVPENNAAPLNCLDAIRDLFTSALSNHCEKKAVFYCLLKKL